MRTKWEILQECRENAHKALDEMCGLEQTPCELNCSSCGKYLATQADFADHFLIPDERYWNLGNCKETS